MRIPRSFALANRRWRVVFDVSKLTSPDDYGNTDLDHAVIYLHPTPPGGWRSVEHAFLHELFHALADASGQEELDASEARVDSLAGLLHQMMITQRGTY